MTTIYDVIRRPLITEKSNIQNTELHQYTFEVAHGASKTLVKDAIETLFEVSVVSVNVINVPLKYSRKWRNRRLSVRRGAYKKAIVTLAPGDTIEAFEGVK